MPIKRRNEKRRVDPVREFEIWDSILTSGIDFFGELPDLGLAALDAYGTPPLVEARLAWRRFGARILAEGKVKDMAPWALMEFGEP